MRDIHARGGDLALLPEIAGLNGTQVVLDVATAAGNTALALAPHARHVVGVDLTPEMLAEATRQAQLRQVANTGAQARGAAGGGRQCGSGG